MFLGAGVAASAASVLAQKSGIQVGVMDGVLGLAGKPEALAKAKELGLAGVQVTIGRASSGEAMPLSSTSLQKQFVDASRTTGVPIVATYLDMLHSSCLKSNPDGRKRVLEGISITKALDAKILMTVFFDKCDMNNRGEQELVAQAFQELAPVAERAGVTIGFENLLTAEEDLRVLEQVASPALKVYYDIGNASNMKNRDAVTELRRIGAKNLCQVHVKDRGYLGEGKVPVRECMAMLAEIGWKGYAVLETGSPSRNIDADVKRNAEYLKSLL
jgi:L-ribulose-5-phosphate 3-epimerase